MHNEICVCAVAEQLQSIDLGKTTPPNTAATGGTKLRARSGERNKTKQKQFTGGTGGVAAVLRSPRAKHLIKHLDTRLYRGFSKSLMFSHHTLPTLLFAKKSSLLTRNVDWQVMSRGRSRTLLVEGSSAVLCATQTWDFVLFNWELVIIRDLLVHTDRLLGVYDYLLLGLDGDHFGVAVGLRERMHEIMNKIKNKLGVGAIPVLT